MALQVDGLSKAFGGKPAVNHLCLTMPGPGVFGLIGTNGAGKTTSIRMMLGIMTPDQGTATWNGRSIRRETVAFGYLPEERGIYMKNKVLEQLLYFGQLRGMTKADARASALYYLERLQVMPYAQMPAEKLSKGNQQKIQLIAALIHRPELIVLDEPFSGLDPLNTEILRELIEELVAEGRYIVMSSHQMATVEQYCENLVLLHHGDTVLSGNLREIKAGYGHTNLRICADGDIDAPAAALGLRLLNRCGPESEYAITDDDMAQAFLRRLIDSGVYPLKYEIAEPSLHEIFIEKVGEPA